MKSSIPEAYRYREAAVAVADLVSKFEEAGELDITPGGRLLAYALDEFRAAQAAYVGDDSTNAREGGRRQ